jgi:hypothetical protein
MRALKNTTLSLGEFFCHIFLYRAVEPVIFSGARDLKGAQKTKIYFILSHIFLFWDLKNVEFLKIWGPASKSRYEFGAQKGQKNFIGAPNFFLPEPVHALHGPVSVILDLSNAIVPLCRIMSNYIEYNKKRLKFESPKFIAKEIPE